MDTPKHSDLHDERAVALTIRIPKSTYLSLLRCAQHYSQKHHRRFDPATAAGFIVTAVLKVVDFH
jgi:hypothetical protein